MNKRRNIPKFRSPVEKRRAMLSRGLSGPDKVTEQAVWKRFFERLSFVLGKNPEVASANRIATRLFRREFNRMAAKCALDEMLVTENRNDNRGFAPMTPR